MIYGFDTTANEKKSKNDIFSLLLKAKMDEFGLTQGNLSKKTGIAQSRISEYLNSKTEPGLDNIRKISSAFDMSISEFFALPDATTHGKSPPPEKPGEAPNPPVVVVQPPAPGPGRDDELEALKQKLEAARDRNDKLTDELLAANAIRNELAAELLAKGKIITTTTEALRIRDVEVAEKREALTAKDKIIQQLVGLLKEAALEHTIPPVLINSIRADRERSQER